jgi:hypothetical protein
MPERLRGRLGPKAGGVPNERKRCTDGASVAGGTPTFTGRARVIARRGDEGA